MVRTCTDQFLHNTVAGTDVAMFLFGFGSFSCTSKPTTNIKSQNNPMWRRMPGLQGEVKWFDRSVLWHHGVCVCEKNTSATLAVHREVHQPRDPRQKQDACSKALQEPAKVVKTVKPQTPKAQWLETLCASLIFRSGKHLELQMPNNRIYSQEI